ncbi:MAG: FHA domain-containing protein [Clostridia bacterium]|nr:FHA domain-containing protein [Clostridia bacterium]
MHIDRERGCCRISFSHPDDLNTIQKNIVAWSNKVEGIVGGGELLREGDHYVLNIRHQESFKAYLEHEIFDLSAFLAFTERLGRFLGDLQSNQMHIYDVVWDVDCVFVGTGITDVSFVYIPGIGELGETSPFRVSDMLAVLSLRVYETDMQALQALSNVVGEFSRWEDQMLLQQDYGGNPFVFARQQLGPFCSTTHPLIEGLRRMFHVPAREGSSLRKQKVRIHLEGMGMLKGRNLYLDFATHFTQNDRFLIGRDLNQVGFLLPYPVVSRVQASISFSQGEWILTDHGSENGTFVEGVRISPGSGYPITQGVCIYFAHREIAFRVKKV